MTTHEKDISSLGSPERFGYSWVQFSHPTPDQEEQFRRWTEILDDKFWDNADFLDVGCGAGRNSYFAMRRGCKGGMAIDLDDRSLAAAQKNLSDFEHITVEKLSAYELEEANQFDIAFSIGVIHHLADPKLAVKKMADAVKPGGHVLIWVYGYENNEWIVRFADPLRKALFSRLPMPMVSLLSWPPAMLVWLIAKLGIVKIEYFKLLKTFSFLHIRHIVFDQMLPKIARYYRRDEAINLLNVESLEFCDVAWVNEMSWAILARKHDGNSNPQSSKPETSPK